MNRLDQIRYARVRHYSHIDKDSKKPQFIYHKITDLDGLKTLLSNKNIQLNTDKAKLGQIGQTGQGNNIDLKLRETSFKSRTMGRVAQHG